MIKTFKSNKEFIEKYEEYLLTDEIKNNLLIGISRRENDTFTFLASVIEDRFVLGLLAGKNLIITSNTKQLDVYLDLVKHMENIDYPGIIGEKSDCELYHQAYQTVTNNSFYTKMDQRIYSCEKTLNYSKPVGSVRLATLEDVPYLVDWAHDFNKEVEEDITIEESKEGLLKKINKQIVFVLIVNDEIVSMAARARSIHKTETVSFVYTPIKHRRKGYASRVVEEITKLIHLEGRIATLYTDLSNPTSNSIYMKIGYKPYCDSVMLNKK